MNSDRRRSRRKQLQASHQKRWLTGRNSVLEALRAARWPVEELWMMPFDSDSCLAEAYELARQHGVKVQTASSDRLFQLCHSEHHQGMIARMGPYPYLTFERLSLQLAANEDAGSALVVVCDRIQDAFNFGAILRNCDAMGVTAVLVGESQQAPVTAQVARSSAGAVHHVPVARTECLLTAVQRLRAAGLTAVAASEKSSAEVWNASVTLPALLVVGNEAAGVSADLLAECDLTVRIPMRGHVDSLNAAAATGILLYEFRRQEWSRRTREDSV